MFSCVPVIHNNNFCLLFLKLFNDVEQKEINKKQAIEDNNYKIIFIFFTKTVTMHNSDHNISFSKKYFFGNFQITIKESQNEG